MGVCYELVICYDRKLDLLLVLFLGEECVDWLNVVMKEFEIGFELGKLVIVGDLIEMLECIVVVMCDCGDYWIEIGGYIDS